MEDIYKKLQEQGEDVGLATVYRVSIAASCIAFCSAVVFLHGFGLLLYRNRA